MKGSRVYYSLLVFVSVLFAFYRFSNYYTVTSEEFLFNDQINSSFPITFFKTAYVDYRYNPPRLRIFSLNPCTTKTQYLLVYLFYGQATEPVPMRIRGESLEGNCPSKYEPAKPCFYASHVFFADLEVTEGLSKVLINLENRNVSLAVEEIGKRYETGLTMCILPVYYYAQWQNIILYIEAWRAQGASRFIVFYHSSTKETRQVLEYYQKLDIVDLRSWPSFGELPSTIAHKYPKIDDSVFIFSYFMAMNLCILDIKTTLGSIADFDEVMVPRSGTVLQYALDEMTGTKIGALSFANNYVAIEPSIYTSNFSGVSSPIFIDKYQPTKYIFNTSIIDLCSTHWVRRFIDPNKKIKDADGALLHLRFNAKGMGGKILDKPFRFFPNNSSEHIENMHNTAETIFGESIPTTSLDFIEVFNKCDDRITKRGNTCHSTSGMCKADMDEVYDWVYDKSKPVFLSGAED